jgi:hypothetical protein
VILNSDEGTVVKRGATKSFSSEDIRSAVQAPVYCEMLGNINPNPDSNYSDSAEALDFVVANEDE